jgi:hypothetical protein
VRTDRVDRVNLEGNYCTNKYARQMLLVPFTERRNHILSDRL